MFNSIIKDRVVDESLILGTLSSSSDHHAATTMYGNGTAADNRGEGGIFHCLL
jgi:hypothetical protein